MACGILSSCSAQPPTQPVYWSGIGESDLYGAGREEVKKLLLLESFLDNFFRQLGEAAAFEKGSAYAIIQTNKIHIKTNHFKVVPA